MSKIKEETRTIEIEYTVETHESKSGEVFVIDDGTIETLKQNFINEINRGNSYKKKTVYDLDIIYDFENFKINKEYLKSYDESNSETYEHFVYYFLKTFYKNYNPVLLQTHIRLSNIDNILKERDELAELNKIRRENNPNQRSFYTSNGIDDLTPTIKSAISTYLRGYDSEGIEITKDNYNQFVDFILDSGMFTFEDEIYSDVNDYTRNTTTYLIDLAISIKHYLGIDYLFHKGLTFNQLNKFNYGRLLYSLLGIELRYLNTESIMSIDVDSIKDISKPIDTFSTDVPSNIKENLRLIYMLTEKFCGVKLHDRYHAITSVDIEREVHSTFVEDVANLLLVNYISDKLLQTNNAIKSDEYLYCDHIIRRFQGKDYLKFEKYLMVEKVHIYLAEKTRYPVGGNAITIYGKVENDEHSWDLSNVDDIPLEDGKNYMYFHKVESAAIPYKKIVKFIIPLSDAVRDTEMSDNIVNTWIGGGNITDTDIEMLTNSDEILKQIRDKELELCELRKKVGKEC